jgi:Protein of unknown function (DUF1254)
VYLWALPAMNMVAIRDGQAAAFGSGNTVAIWKDRISAKTVISTVNPDVICGLAFVDLEDGPLVFRGRAADAGFALGRRQVIPGGKDRGAPLEQCVARSIHFPGRFRQRSRRRQCAPFSSQLSLERTGQEIGKAEREIGTRRVTTKIEAAEARC